MTSCISVWSNSAQSSLAEDSNAGMNITKLSPGERLAARNDSCQNRAVVGRQFRKSAMIVILFAARFKLTEIGRSGAVKGGRPMLTRFVDVLRDAAFATAVQRFCMFHS